MNHYYKRHFALQKAGRTLLAMLILWAYNVQSVHAQCIPSSTTPVSFTSVTTTDETCPQNGTITVNGAAGGGNVYMYEIFDGPILRGIQSQNVFPALRAGTYKIRITGCNGKFKEAQATVASKYIRFNESPFLGLYAFPDGTGFRCGAVNNGRIMLKQSEQCYFTTAPGRTLLLGDTQYLRWPLRYQISTNSDPYTGFNGVPFQNFPAREHMPIIDFLTPGQPTVGTTISHVDTISGLAAGQTYYLRVTDQCGVFSTTTVTMPVPATETLGYSFSLSDPARPGGGNVVATKPGCIQLGFLKFTVNGVAVNTLPENNKNLPLNITITRQDNGDTIAKDLGVYFISSFYGGIKYDSIPRVPIIVKITDACGVVTTFTPAPLPLPAFHLQAYASCQQKGYFRVTPYDVAPSPVIRAQVYNASNTLIIDKMLRRMVIGSPLPYDYDDLVLSLPPSTPNDSIYNASYIPSYGIYHIKYTDGCGRTDSITFDFQPVAGSDPAPQYTFKTYHPPCTTADILDVTVQQTNASPVTKVYLISGPAGITYPKARKTLYQQSGYDSLKAGTYTQRSEYSCNSISDVVFTINLPIPPSPLNGTITFTPNQIICNADVNNGSGIVQANISSTGDIYTAVINNLPKVHMTQAPASYLQKIGHSKTGAPIVTPLELGTYSGGTGYWVSANFGIQPYGAPDTTTVSQYSMYNLNELAGSYLAGSATNFDVGTYTLEMYDKCTGAVITSTTFTVNYVPYVPLGLGASAAYVCDGGTGVKLFASPRGGTPQYKYQIKPATDPDEAYTTVQTDSVFTLPAPPATIAGSVYTLRVIDNCGKSFVGQVPVNNFTGEFIIFPYNNCLGATARIITGFIPGATYTWTKPDGTVIVTNSNEISVVNFGPSDVGTYSVSINAMNGCIVRTATGLITNGCEVNGPLPVKLLSFTAYKNSARNVDLKWVTASEIDNKAFEIQRSADGVNFTTIQIMDSKATNGNSAITLTYNTVDATAAALQKQLLYYRLKQVNKNGVYVYSQVNKVYFDKGFYVGTVYPVPFSSYMNIDVMTENRTPVTITLSSADGRSVAASTLPATAGANSYQFTPNANLKSGVYVLKIVQGNNVYTQNVNCIK